MARGDQIHEQGGAVRRAGDAGASVQNSRALAGVLDAGVHRAVWCGCGSEGPGHEVVPALVKPGMSKSFGTIVGMKQAFESQQLPTALLPWSRFLHLWEDPTKPPAHHRRHKNFKEMPDSHC